MILTPQLWTCISDWLTNEVGPGSFESWLKPLEVDYEACTETTVVLIAPTRFMLDWVLRHYSDLIERGVKSALDIPEVRIQFVVPEKKAVPVSIPAIPAEQIQATPVVAPAPVAQLAPVQQAMHAPELTIQPQIVTQADAIPAVVVPQYTGNPLDPRFTFDNFVVGKSNEFAYAAAKRIAESSDIAYNPFILHGGVGLGKSHLMHSIAWHIQETQPERTVMFISAEKFLHNFISALKNKNTLSFKETFRNVDVLMIDDVQFIAGKEATQEEFFHTFESLVGERKQVILTADKSPHEMQGIEDRLRSRLGWGLTTEVHKPDVETRLAILEAKAQKLNVDISKTVGMMLASKIDTNVRELEGAVNRLAAHAHLVQQEITPESAQELLRDLFRHMDREVLITDIQKKVAEYYNIKVTDMTSARRVRAVARPRQIAMYLAKKLTTKSFPEIGKNFGNRDHTTVMHASKTVDRLSDTDASLADDVHILTTMLKNI